MKGPFPPPANRPAAAFLAIVWFGVGVLAIYAGVASGRWIGILLGAISIGYSMLWVKVYRTGQYLRFRINKERDP